MSLLGTFKKTFRSTSGQKKGTKTKAAVAKEDKQVKKDTVLEKSTEAAEKGQPRKLVLRPLVTEKSLLAQEHDVVIFQVPVGIGKRDIAAIVQEQYGVVPRNIRTATFSGKLRRRGRSFGTTPAWKKAYVQVDDVSKFSE